jgi:copper chaperone
MTRIHIANMACGGCAKGVTATLRTAAPGAAVELDLARREVTLDQDVGAPVIEALMADGWEARLVLA